MTRYVRAAAAGLVGTAICYGALASAAFLPWRQPPQPPSPQPPPAIQSTNNVPNVPHVVPAGTVAGETGATEPVKPSTDTTDGALRLPDGTFCPLTHTDVQGEISGFLARVTVKQQFVNPTSDRIEAVYTFPLPQHAAVDDMTMHVGDRVVRGLIKRRTEAKEIYERAREAGHTAALLEQERTNIFTQSVANIPPNAPVTIEISYVELLEYDEGRYRFVFPMVVGPRYIPGEPTSKGNGWSPNTTSVPDAGRITPPVAGVQYGKKGTRAGHDISLSLKLDAGVPLKALQSITHQVDLQRPSSGTTRVTLRTEREIPNRDFVLTYGTAGTGIEDAVLTHAAAGKAGEAAGGYFTMILQPPDRVKDEDVTPRELVFVLDTSGSMSGYPMETSKAIMRRALGSLRAGDTFNLITFAGDTQVLFPKPVDASTANIERAKAFIERLTGGGGTEMMKAIRTALGDQVVAGDCASDEGCIGEPPTAAGAIRVVCFLTDGYVGNDMAIIDEIQKRPGTRVFSMGIGSSVNRFLLDGMARAGRGEVEYVLRAEDAAKSADRFYKRVHTPVLTDISVEWGSLPVEQILPTRPLDLFAARPVVIVGRYRQAATGTVTLRGLRAGQPFSRQIRVALPKTEAGNGAVAQLWARRQIEDLMNRDLTGAQQQQMRPELEEKITNLGLQYRLMTQFTAFVAVEERTVVEGGQQRTIQVPVEMPHNVSPEGVFGDTTLVAAASPTAMRMNPSGGIGGGLMRNGPVPAPPPQTGPTAAREQVIAEPVAKSSDERERRDEDKSLASKLHPALSELVACVERGGDRKALAACGVDERGRVRVDVWLNAAPAADLIARLAKTGLVIASSRSEAVGGWLTGHVEVTRLPALVAMTEVRLIARAR